jgi:hypothetical protein
LNITDGGVESSTVTCDLNGAKRPDDPHAPLVMVVAGKGVVTKPASAPVAATVTGDPATFVWTVTGPDSGSGTGPDSDTGGTIAFTRRDKLAEFLSPAVLRVECFSKIDDHALVTVAKNFRDTCLSWRKVVGESSLAEFVARRLMLPVLGVLLVVLVFNFVVSGGVANDFREANAHLAALRKTSSAEAVTGERRREAIDRFASRLPVDASRLADLVATVVPDSIVLNELAIAPLLRTPEAGKPLQQHLRTVIIGGETTSPGSITVFNESLGALRLGTVRLASLKQDVERGKLIFKIEITL